MPAADCRPYDMNYITNAAGINGFPQSPTQIVMYYLTLHHNFFSFSMKKS